ncbi:MAG: hypothetical protein D6722_23155, partial [Bacteroidetes bacterium]
LFNIIAAAAVAGVKDFHLILKKPLPPPHLAGRSAGRRPWLCLDRPGELSYLRSPKGASAWK